MRRIAPLFALVMACGVETSTDAGSSDAGAEADTEAIHDGGPLDAGPPALDTSETLDDGGAPGLDVGLEGDAGDADAGVDAGTSDAGPPDAGPPFVQTDVLQVRFATDVVTDSTRILPLGTDVLVVGGASGDRRQDLFVARLDGNYEVRWAQRYALEGVARLRRAIVSGDALVLLANLSDSSGGTGTRYGVVVTLSTADGSVRAATQVGEGLETLEDLVLLDAGALAIVGASRSYDREIGILDRPFVVVLEPTGEVRWARSVHRTLGGGRGLAIASGPGTDLTIAVERPTPSEPVELLTIASTGPIRRGWEVGGVVGTPVSLDTTGTAMALVSSYTVASGISYARSTTYTELDAAAGTVARAWGLYGTTLDASFSDARVAFAQQSNPRNADLWVFDRSGAPVGGRSLAPGGPTSSGDAFWGAALDGTGVRGVARIDATLWLVRSPLGAGGDGCVVPSLTTSPLASTPMLGALTAVSVTVTPSVTAAPVTASALAMTRMDECPP